MSQRFPAYPVALTAAFVALSVAGRIDWSVWWVVSPLLFAWTVSTLLALATKDK